MKRIVETELIKHRTYVEKRDQTNILLELAYRVKYQDGVSRTYTSAKNSSSIQGGFSPRSHKRRMDRRE